MGEPINPHGRGRVLRALLLDDEFLKAVERALEEEGAGLSLGEALGAVEQAWQEIRRQVPEAVELRARVLLATGEPGEARRYVSEQTGLAPAGIVAYMEDLAQGVRVRLSPAAAEELVGLLAAARLREGTDRVRAVNRVGVREAVRLLGWLYATAGERLKSAAQLPQLERILQPVVSELRLAPALSAAVRTRLEADFAPRDWEGAARVLDLYGRDSSEPGRERVQLAILKLAKGSRGELLRMTDAARQDFRDVLSWADLRKD